MTVAGRPDRSLLDGASIDPAVASLRPDYRVLLLVVTGLADESATEQGPEPISEALLTRAEDDARRVLAEGPVEEIAHMAAWREAYRAFGAKPQRTRNSLEALLRRVPSGLPRVNPITDVYNAISVLHRLPLGGEDAAHYAGPPRLLRAVGTEEFDTAADGEPVVEHPDPGEVVWADQAGVTCRRWNWRQGRRTRLRPDTDSALFILDALGPMDDVALTAAADELVHELTRCRPSAASERRLLAATPAEDAR